MDHRRNKRISTHKNVGIEYPGGRTATGWTRNVSGGGMFVANGASEKLKTRERSTFLKEDWPKIVRHIERLGLDTADLLDRETA